MKVVLGPDAPKGCNGKVGSSGSQLHYRKNEPACDACRNAAQHYNRLLKAAHGKPVTPREPSKCTRVWTPDHPIQRYGRWWKNETDAEEYGRRDRLRHAARRAGWAYQTIEDLDAFEVFRQAKIEKDLEAQEKRALEKVETARVRKTHQRAKNATLRNQVGKEYIRAYRNTNPITSDDKLTLIKKMIEDRTPIMDFMIRTSQLVGADLKGNNGNG